VEREKRKLKKVMNQEKVKKKRVDEGRNGEET
jgi:hypothetical protein